MPNLYKNTNRLQRHIVNYHLISVHSKCVFLNVYHLVVFRQGMPYCRTTRALKLMRAPKKQAKSRTISLSKKTWFMSLHT